MSATEKLIDAVRMRDKMIQCHKSAKFLKAEKWDSFFEEHKLLVQAVMKKENCDEINVLLKLQHKFDGVELMLMIAVVAQMLEPNINIINQKNGNTNQKTSR